ncbi:MAG: ATP-binding protein [Ilumatobacteraceae bacterium]
MFLPPPLLDVALPAEQSAPRLARRELRKMLEDVAPAEFTDDALLLTSEIVSNATVIGGPCRLSAWYLPDDGALRVEVHDESPVVPVMSAARTPDQVSGRGLRIVDSIASRWGIDRDEIGKSVWFEMYIKGALRTTAITG